jgi:hypothetical protein
MAVPQRGTAPVDPKTGYIGYHSRRQFGIFRLSAPYPPSGATRLALSPPGGANASELAFGKAIEIHSAPFFHKAVNSPLNRLTTGDLW